jgi:predicted enzyme related to lactoylglutathione lyase
LRVHRRTADGRPCQGRTQTRPLVILYADDLEDTQRRLEDAGARIVKPVFSFPGGRRFHFLDPDGYELAVWSDK